MKPDASILTMYAVTPCHAGSGSSLGVVDLPIQRERHTNWPVIQSSGMKGAMRAHFDKFKGQITNKPQEEQFAEITKLLFGSDKPEFAGSLSVSDAKILAFPMRSNIAPFLWITCPAVLKRLNRDLKLAGKPNCGDLSSLDNLGKESAWCWAGKISGTVLLEDMEVTSAETPSLEDMEVTSAETPSVEAFTPFFVMAEKLLIVHDAVFNYGVTHSTSITAQIKIDQSTGTTQSGSLRYQEELPADTIMYSVIFWGDSRDKDTSFKAETIKGYIQDEVMASHLQAGGDETCGRGIFELNWK